MPQEWQILLYAGHLFLAWIVPQFLHWLSFDCFRFLLRVSICPCLESPDCLLKLLKRLLTASTLFPADTDIELSCSWQAVLKSLDYLNRFVHRQFLTHIDELFPNFGIQTAEYNPVPYHIVLFCKATIPCFDSQSSDKVVNGIWPLCFVVKTISCKYRVQLGFHVCFKAFVMRFQFLLVAFIKGGPCFVDQTRPSSPTHNMTLYQLQAYLLMVLRI